MGMRRELTTLLLAAATVAGCGSAAPTSSAPPATPADQRVRSDARRIVLRGDFGPDEFGPLELRGRYRATFVQRGTGVDFAAEVPFTAHLEQDRPGGGAPRRIALFETAAPTGATTVTAQGRWRLLVDFGDSPFSVTLAPASA